MKKKFFAFFLVVSFLFACLFSGVACGGGGGGNGGNGGGGDGGGGGDPNWPTYANVTYQVSNVKGGVLLEDINFTREGEFPQEFHVPKYVNGKKVVRIGYWAFRDVHQDEYLGHNWASFNDPIHNFPYQKIIVPDTVEIIDSGAFSLCTAKEIEFQGANTRFGNFAGGEVNSAFSGCWLLKKVTLPTNLDVIHHQMFENCKSLTDIVIPNGVTYIDWMAFSNCQSLVTITIPASVTEIARGAFYNGYALETVYCDGTPTIYTDNVDHGPSFKNCGVDRVFDIIYR